MVAQRALPTVSKRKCLYQTLGLPLAPLERLKGTSRLILFKLFLCRGRCDCTTLRFAKICPSALLVSFLDKLFIDEIWALTYLRLERKHGLVFLRSFKKSFFLLSLPNFLAEEKAVQMFSRELPFKPYRTWHVRLERRIDVLRVLDHSFKLHETLKLLPFFLPIIKNLLIPHVQRRYLLLL